MGLQAAEPLARILNSVEAGSPWPEQLLLARAFFFSKPMIGQRTPYGYRAITSCSTLTEDGQRADGLS